ncbi:hypothetical protein [Planotetraspora phitsanulokensis]|uniref:hypothetical protein n=1 Tax=Planotetraspora phitsanulokensis TaxID=575192 RepID=UPI001951010E|nr:hypothetical protein [Planotetraspora phitsanulokensis]
MDVKLIVACLGIIVFLFVAIGAGIAGVWPLFLAGILLTAVAIACALMMGERWRSITEARAQRSRRR